MNRIFTDVTVVIETPFVAGIQRVTCKLSQELIALMPNSFCLMYYSSDDDVFYFVSHALFVDWVARKISSDDLKEKIKQQETFDKQGFRAGDIFLDLDSVWTSVTCPRYYLYKQLKARGTRVVSYIYDIIPITFPQFVQKRNLIFFPSYLGAVYNYADCVITSTQSVLDDMHSLAEKIGVSMPQGIVSWLGSDFVEGKAISDKADKEVIKALSARKYILCVGTIEPRKNQRMLLDAFEEQLYAEGFSLVVVGKIGWQVENLRRRFLGGAEQGSRLFYFSHANDATLAWLYEHAFLVSIPTFEEGFCLPVVEALQYGTPVLLPDIPVLREVGRDYGEYFRVNDEGDFIAKVIALKQDEDKYQVLCQHVQEFQPFTWHDAANVIANFLQQELQKEENETDAPPILTRTSPEQAEYEDYVQSYVRKRGIYPEICCLQDEITGQISLVGPKYFRLPLSGHVTLKVWLGIAENECREVHLQYAFISHECEQRTQMELHPCDVKFRHGRNELPLEIERNPRERFLYLRLQTASRNCELYVPLKGRKHGK